MEKGIRFSIINILIWIPLILTVVPGVLILWLYKKIFTCLVVKLFRPNYRPPNDITDTVMCQGGSYDYPNTNAAQVWVVDGPWITASEFSEHFHKCFLEGNSDKYRNLLAYVTTCGTFSFYAHCQPNELDLTWHIQEYKIEQYGHQSLNSWAVTWMTTNTFEKGRPVWQVAILHLTNPSSGAQETGIVAKFSHSLVDGYSFVHMVGKLTDNPAPYIVPDTTFGWKDKLNYFYNAPRGVFAFWKNQAFSRDSQSPYKKIALTATKTETWLMSFATLDLETVKLIRKASNSHFASLMVAAQMGALRRLLMESKTEEDLPEKLWVASSMPWPNHPMKLTNHWTMGFFKCPVRIANPLERVQMTEAFYQDYKSKENDTMGMFGLMPAFRQLPAWAVRFFAHYDPALSNVNAFFASLMQSSKKHYLLGRPVKKLYLPLAIPDVSPITLYGVTTSHSGQIDLSISACTGAMVRSQEELDRLTQVYFIEELDSVAALCGLKCASVAVDDPYVGSGKGKEMPTITVEVANNKEITSKTATTPFLQP